MKINEFRLRLYPEDYRQNYSFFKDVLGFTISYEWDRDESKGVMFDVGGTTLELLWPVVEEYKDMVTGSGLSLRVEDVHELFGQLKNVVTISYEPHETPWGDVSFGIVAPGGYKITFFSKTKEYND